MQPEAPPAPPPQAPAPQPTPQTLPQPPQQGSGYDFIMNPPKPPRRSILPGDTTPLIRVIIVLVGLLVLLIIFSVVKNLFTHSNTPALITVAQDQQEMIHITTNATQSSTGSSGQQPNLSDSNKNFALTAQVSMTSAQSDLLVYMKNNHKKVKTKQLSATTSANLDSQFEAAAQNNTYDQLFTQTMQNKLKAYEQALRIAYSQTSGPKGRALLSQDYNGAQLLLQQLSAPSN